MRRKEINFTPHFSQKQGYVKVYQKNRLKDLIYIQENKSCNEQTVKSLFRAVVEPVLGKDIESIVLCRLGEKSKKDFNGTLKRLEYSDAKVYDFSTVPINDKFTHVLKNNIWDETEFVYIIADRFGASFIFDYEEGDVDGFAQIYILYNSKNLSESFHIINSNSKLDLTTYYERLKPDRRHNHILNNSIRKIIENLNETNDEILISQIEKETVEDNTELKSRLDFLSTKSSYIAHEMRNLLSICNLYTEIIEKQKDKISFTNKDAETSINNAADCIKKSLKMTGSLLLDFKSLKNGDLKAYDLKTMINSAIELAKVYSTGENINFKNEIEQSVNILADENKLLTVLINLIKNAVESINEKGEITINAKVEEESVKIIIANNGNPIPKEIQKNIFNEEFTTKPAGSGLGLVICKKTLEEQFAQLKLVKSDEISTEFEITVLRSET